ncbi:MAG TPA: hotdog domain-containing protein [Patescibacteria group bacterium]|nr:hotdog domain-containing protein [Patescibacteria group bacterium]
MPTDPASIPVGLEHTFEREVLFEYTIAHHNPKLPPVLSTPAMIGMMELAAARAVEPALAPGEITVGTRIEVDHLKASTTGARVRVWARYEGAEGRFLVFSVSAHEGEKQIGRGRVFRAIVDPSRHGQKK